MDVTSTSGEQHRNDDENRGPSFPESLERNRMLSLGISSFSGDFTPEELHSMAEEQYRQDRSSRKNRIIAVMFTYISVLCESFASHSVYFTLMPYLVQDPVKSDNFSRFMYLLSYGIAFLSGFFTDKRVSRYWTLVLGFLIFLPGYVMLYAITDERLHICTVDIQTNQECFCGSLSTGYGIQGKACPCLLLVALLIISIGIGLVWGNNVIYGADQIQSRSTLVPMYFHGYYFVMQLGIGLAYFIVYGEKEENAPYLAGAGLASACFSFLAFLVGTWFYQKEHTRQLEDPFMKVIDTVSMSVKVPKSTIQRNDTRTETNTSVLEWLIDQGQLDRRDVDDVRRYVRLMLVFLTLAFFEVVLQQQDFIFNLQGQVLKLPPWELKHNASDTLIIPQTMKYPIGWFTSGCNLIVIVVLIPTVLVVCHFASKKKIKALTLSTSTVQHRLIVGLLCSAMSSVIGGLVTSISWYYSRHCDSDYCAMELYHEGDQVYAGSGIFIKWESIQCAFAALSEILVRVTAYQLAYLEAPDTEHYRMHGMFVCLLYLSGEIGVALGWISIRVAENYFCDEIVAGNCHVNVGVLIWYYYGLAVFQWVGFILTLVTLTDYFYWTVHGKGYPFMEKMKNFMKCCLRTTRANTT